MLNILLSSYYYNVNIQLYDFIKKEKNNFKLYRFN